MAESTTHSAIDTELVKELYTLLGKNRVMMSPAERSAYAYDGQHTRALPDVVVHAHTTEEIAGIVKCAVRYHVPLVTRGAGSGMTGGAVPEKGGILLNLERMNQIRRIDAEDRIAYVQPGVITADLQEKAEQCGLYYPPEPASAKFSTIGGNIAESAGGLGCVKYGLTKDFIAGLVFVTPAGVIVRTGVYSELMSPLDAGSIIAGSEGTLGIVAEAAIRLIPLPESRLTILAIFHSLVDAARASNAVLSSGVGPAVLEFMDGKCIDTVREYVSMPVPEDAGAALIVELDGAREEIEAARHTLTAALEAADPIEYRSAETFEERTELWKLRKSLSPAIAKIAPLKFNEDVCVPISKIPELVAAVENLGRELVVPVVAFGHTGDGNIHVNFLTHWDRPDEVRRAEKAVGLLFRIVVSLGGTLSGEHGIGIAKRPYLGYALDEATIAFEKHIKYAVDPQNIMNPGKIFPE